MKMVGFLMIGMTMMKDIHQYSTRYKIFHFSEKMLPCIQHHDFQLFLKTLLPLEQQQQQSLPLIFNDNFLGMILYWNLFALNNYFLIFLNFFRCSYSLCLGQPVFFIKIKRIS